MSRDRATVRAVAATTAPASAAAAAPAVPGAEPRPIDRLFAVYAVFSGLAIAFPHRPGFWPAIMAVHVAAAVLALRPAAVATVLGPIGRHMPVIARFLRGAYPLLLIPVLYAELAVLNLSVHGGRYFDDLVIIWESTLFGGLPSQTLAAALPWLPLSEALHAAYLSYYLIIYGPPLLLFLAGRHADFDAVVFTVMVTFFVHYLIFIYFPVQGPRYLFPAPDGAVAEGVMYRMTHAILESGSSQGAAFPSSHVAVAVAQCALAFRLLPRLFPLLVVVTAGLALGTVYGGFHYAIDALAGLAVGIAVVAAAPALARGLGRTAAQPLSSSQPGGSLPGPR